MVGTGGTGVQGSRGPEAFPISLGEYPHWFMIMACWQCRKHNYEPIMSIKHPQSGDKPESMISPHTQTLQESQMCHMDLDGWKINNIHLFWGCLKGFYPIISIVSRSPIVRSILGASALVPRKHIPPELDVPIFKITTACSMVCCVTFVLRFIFCCRCGGLAVQMWHRAGWGGNRCTYMVYDCMGRCQPVAILKCSWRFTEKEGPTAKQQTSLQNFQNGWCLFCGPKKC